MSLFQFAHLSSAAAFGHDYPTNCCFVPRSPDVSAVGRYDVGNDGFLDLEELKRMMEKLGAPQTHIGLKQMIREATEDDTVNMISFRAVRAGSWCWRSGS